MGNLQTKWNYARSKEFVTRIPKETALIFLYLNQSDIMT